MKGDFVNVLGRLSEAGVRFVLIGGHALIVHGGTLTTEDIDVCLDFTADNLLSLQSALSDLHPVHRMTPQRLPLSLTRENCGQFKNLYLDTDAGQLDCLSYVEGVGDYRQVEQASVIVEVKQIRFRVVSREALIQSKKALNRPRDRQAIEELESLKKIENIEKQ